MYSSTETYQYWWTVYFKSSKSTTVNLRDIVPLAQVKMVTGQGVVFWIVKESISRCLME